ncbi:STAS domain-containing protein [Roseateles koreensis]|uniref:STAS domain-containing protein n=1 Tax=Roseateles koreensis TaxID=2987526 RepID=A0ABT5KSQ8_9BURK|nr:STAS domain-containing protein [Roseateles koreensis]MDC8785964.1 STAS domain-containing protein [Roseateles koreensis]
MDTQMGSDTTSTVWKLGGELTVTAAAETQLRWLEQLATLRGPLALDLSAVEDIDSAGLQLLVALRHSVGALGYGLTLEAISPTVQSALDCYGLTGEMTALHAPAQSPVEGSIHVNE